MVPSNRSTRRARLQRRVALFVLVALIAVLGSGVAVAQSSLGFDLACRNNLTVTGGLSSYPENGLNLIGVLGQPTAGVSAATSVALRGGYLQPLTVQAVHAEDAPAPPAISAQGDQILNLPLISKVVRIVRGGC